MSVENLCKCGCGLPAKNLWRQGHNRSSVTAGSTAPPNPSGLCLCGCGSKTPIAPRTVHKLGIVGGEPQRYIPGHQRAVKYMREGPNPSGLCMCGCGAPAPIATLSNRSTGSVAGKPMRFIHNHHTRSASAYYLVEDRGYKTPCWIWQMSKDENGYGRKSAPYKGGYRSIGAHRAYYEEFKGPIPSGYDVDHLCFVPSCVNPDHLEAVTPLENERRRRYVMLSEDKIPTIKLLRSWGVPYGKIGAIFGVKATTICAICQGLNWKDL